MQAVAAPDPPAPAPPAAALSAADLSAVLLCVGDLHAGAAADDAMSTLPVLILRLLSGLVRSTSSAFTQVDPVLGESSGHMLPAEPWTVEWIAPRFQANVADHPVVAYAARTRDGSAQAISDFLTPRQFHATGLYRAVFGPMGIEDQLSIGMVGSAGLMIGLSFNRVRRGFSDRDRGVLNALRPHVLQAYLSARRAQALRNADGVRRGTVVDRLPVGLVCVDRRGTVVWATEPAGAMLASHFPDAADSIHGLPHAVRVWLRRAAAATGGPLLSRGSGVDLQVRRCALKDGHAVLLLQQTPTPSADPPPLERFGLTTAEAAVMRRMAAGATVGRAAADLRVSPRTVQKHLERVFHKLGVNTLAAACVKVLAPA